METTALEQQFQATIRAEYQSGLSLESLSNQYGLLEADIARILDLPKERPKIDPTKVKRKPKIKAPTVKGKPKIRTVSKQNGNGSGNGKTFPIYHTIPNKWNNKATILLHSGKKKNLFYPRVRRYQIICHTKQGVSHTPKLDIILAVEHGTKVNEITEVDQNIKALNLPPAMDKEERFQVDTKALAKACSNKKPILFTFRNGTTVKAVPICFDQYEILVQEQQSEAKVILFRHALYDMVKVS